MKRKKPLIYLEKKASAWGRLRGLDKSLENALALTLACLPDALLPVARRAEMTVLLTTDKAVQTLNHDFRGINKPTNVLSFPFLTRRELVRLGGGKEPIYAGDIAIAYATTEKEARRDGKLLLDHTTHLAVHGALHLFGYDHDTPARAARMEKLEKEIMATLGLGDPYA